VDLIPGRFKLETLELVSGTPASSIQLKRVRENIDLLSLEAG